MNATFRVYSKDVFYWESEGLRYTFNGKETDTETDLQDYGMRIYNPRLGKFLSVDPLSPDYPWYTPYQFAGNKPIWAIDLDGLEEAIMNYAGLPQKPGYTRAIRVYAALNLSMGAQIGISAAVIEQLKANASAGGVSGEIGVFIDTYEDGRMDVGLLVTNSDAQYSYGVQLGPIAAGETLSNERVVTISVQQGVVESNEGEMTKKTSGGIFGVATEEVNGSLDQITWFSVGVGVQAILGAEVEVTALSYYAPGETQYFSAPDPYPIDPAAPLKPTAPTSPQDNMQPAPLNGPVSPAAVPAPQAPSGVYPAEKVVTPQDNLPPPPVFYPKQ